MPHETEKNKLKAEKADSLPIPKNILALFLCSLLFVGGIILITSTPTDWHLFIGIITIQAGIILFIFTFDELIRRRLQPRQLKINYCSICGNPTVTPIGQRQAICLDCQEKIISSQTTRKSEKKKNPESNPL
jgi:hypothetical protein